jgi:hypothetical protein
MLQPNGVGNIRSRQVPWSSPEYDWLRADPRFQAFLQVNLD